MVYQMSIWSYENLKEDIIASTCQWISNSDGEGQVMAIQGPPGVGKTSIIRDGLAKVLTDIKCGVALGGATNSCFKMVLIIIEGSTLIKLYQCCN